jgi:hypothetical protein
MTPSLLPAVSKVEMDMIDMGDIGRGLALHED